MKKTKIPVPIIVFVALLIVFVIILLALVMPTFTNLSKYNDDHAAITAKIADCDDVLANQTSVEAKIDEMTKQYNENQENLYVDAKSSVKDLQDIFADLGIDMSSLTRGEGVQDSQGRTSMGGIPLYYTNLMFSYTGAKDKTLQLIHYLEQESKGCYFIDSLSMSEIEGSQEYATSFNVILPIQQNPLHNYKDFTMANLLPIDFSQISTYITLAVILILSVVLCMLAYRLMNVVPAKWLCDYDEEPDESLFGTRYIFKQSGIYTSALFAIFNLGIFAFFGYSYYTIFFLLISITMLLIAMSDFKYTIIPDQFTIALAVLCVALAITDLFTQQIFIKEWWSIPLGAVCGGGSLMLINLFSIVILKKNGMGFGDVKLMLALGACLGFPMVFSGLLIAVFIAFLYIIFLLIKKIFSKNEVSSYFPFGPFLCIGSLCSMFLVNVINYGLDLYFSLFSLSY